MQTEEKEEEGRYEKENLRKHETAVPSSTDFGATVDRYLLAHMPSWAQIYLEDKDQDSSPPLIH